MGETTGQRRCPKCGAPANRVSVKYAFIKIGAYSFYRVIEIDVIRKINSGSASQQYA